MKIRALLSDIETELEGRRGWKTAAADLLGVDAAFVSRVLKDDDWGVSPETIRRIAFITSTPESFWTDGKGSKRWQDVAQEHSFSTTYSRFREAIDELESAAAIYHAHAARGHATDLDAAVLREKWLRLPGVREVLTGRDHAAAAEATLDFVHLIRESFQIDRLREEHNRLRFWQLMGPLA